MESPITTQKEPEVVVRDKLAWRRKKRKRRRYFPFPHEEREEGLIMAWETSAAHQTSLVDHGVTWLRRNGTGLVKRAIYAGYK